MDLPTTPIGKQQVIDLRAGAIIRKESKSARYLGCSARFLLVLILLLKCALLTAWLVREYDNFASGCSYLANGFEYDDDYEDTDDTSRREKRSLLLTDDDLDPRAISPLSKKRRPFGGAGGTKTQSTMVTMTNTQMLPAVGEKLKMKTIRSRLEAVSPNLYEEEEEEEEGEGGEGTREREWQGGEAEMEIELSPLVHISPILSRRDNRPIPIAYENIIPEQTKKRKKHKGKGRKKSKSSSVAPPSTTTTMETTTRKRKGKKGLGRKNKKKEGTEQTKSPRHLFSSGTAPTPRPHGSSFLLGAVDPRDPQFSNKGEIRGYPMQKASRRPKKPELKLSKETRMMWDMDELNYTTLAMAPRTTEMTRDRETQSMDNKIKHVQQPESQLPRPLWEESTQAAPPPRKEFYSTHKSTKPTPRPVEVPTRKVSTRPPTTTEQVAEYFVQTIRDPPIRDEYQAPPTYEEEEEESSLEILEKAAAFDNIVPQMATRSPVVLHGFDRSLDAILEAGLPVPAPTTTTRPLTVEENYRFQDQLTSFTSSAVCIARSLFDIWCFCQLLCSIPYFVGLCVVRRSLFVAHFVLDILMLVIGFIFSITTVVFSVVLYILVGEMRQSTLWKWLVFAVVMNVILVIYSACVIVSMRCCEQLVQARKFKLQTSSYTPGEAL